MYLKSSKRSSFKVILKGIPASPGIGEGPPLIVENVRNPLVNSDERNFVLIAPYATPMLTLLMLKSLAIITEKGGKLSHAAIVARELGIPCVVGVERCIQKLKEVNWILVNGNRGVIYGFKNVPRQVSFSHE
jgi:pyruvate,water dikinase